jgi:hypothetical protein
MGLAGADFSALIWQNATALWCILPMACSVTMQRAIALPIGRRLRASLVCTHRQKTSQKAMTGAKIPMAIESAIGFGS